MLTTTVTLKGNLATAPALRFTPTGQQLAERRVLLNARRQNDAGEWEDTEPIRHLVTCFGTLAENVTESLRTGGRVIVIGRTVPTPGPTRTPATSAQRPASWPTAATALRRATAGPTRTRQTQTDDTAAE